MRGDARSVCISLSGQRNFERLQNDDLGVAFGLGFFCLPSAGFLFASALKMKGKCYSETSDFQQTTHR
jgi:hypothetical protein